MTRMKDVSHTNPTDPRNVFGELFRRGPSTVADGGTPAGETRSEDETATETEEQKRERMKDISHTASEDDDRNPNRVWSRGSADEVREE